MRCNRCGSHGAGMTTPPVLPALAGLAWSRHKKPGFSTRVASHVSGREVRVALMEYRRSTSSRPSTAASALRSAAAFAGLGSTSLQSLMGFFLQLPGQFGTFLYTDPDDGPSPAKSRHRQRSDTSLHPDAYARRFHRAGSVGHQRPNVYLNGVAQHRQLRSSRRRISTFTTAPAAASPSQPTSPTRSTAASSTTRWISRSSCRACGSSTA